jgi:hypothetical protein
MFSGHLFGHGYARFRNAARLPCDKVPSMKRLLLILGVVLFVLGIVALIHPTFDYQKREEIARIGRIKATVDHPETAKVPVAATAALLISGVVLIVLGSRAK